MDVEFPGKEEVNQQQSMHTERQFLTTKLTWPILAGAEADLNSRVLSRSEIDDICVKDHLQYSQ